MILVTGASGNVGSAVLADLRQRQVPVRVGARQRTAVNQGETETVRLDFLDASTFEIAVEGCQAVFLLRPPAIANPRQTLIPFMDVARSRGVQQIVFVSVAGAGENPLVPHAAIEQHLQQSAGDWTILRPGFFAQNLGDAYRQDIVQDDRLYVPAGAGRVAFIDTRDLAAVAVAALLDPALHQRQIYTLTGPEAVTFTEVAQLLSVELGRAIAYQPASIFGYGWHLSHRQLPIAQVMVQTLLHVGLRLGQAARIDNTLATLLEHPPRRLQDYIRDYRHLWLKSE